jgi:hypothetical protein
MKRILKITVVVVAALAVLGFIVGDGDETQRAAATATSGPRLMSRVEICREAERVIEKSLKAPSARKWVQDCISDGSYQMSQTANAEGRPEWKVAGQVDSQNSFGAMLRSTWQVTLTDFGDGNYRHTIDAFQ